MTYRVAREICALVACTVIAGSGVAAAGQQSDPTSLSLEDLMATPVDQVYGASKFLQKVTDAPAAVTVITAEDIRLYGYRTLADVLRSVEGISITYDRNYTYLGMRGLSRPGDLNSRVLLLVDGHRMNNNVDDQAMLGSDFQLDLGLVDRVEVIRGPSAALYGSSAFSAVIAVITKRGQQLNGVEVAGSLATYDTARGRVSAGKQFANGLELLISGAMHQSDGVNRLFFPEFETAAGSGGYAVGSDGERANSAAFSVLAGNFTLHGLYADRTKEIPTASFDTLFNSRREQTADKRASFDLQYTREIGQSTKILARTYWDRSLYDGFYPYAGSDADAVESVVMNRDHFDGLWWGGELDVSRRVKRSHNITIGGEFRHNIRQNLLNYDDDPRVVYIDETPRTYTVALNVQDEYTVNRHVLVNLAAREERIVTGATGFTPKVGVILSPHPGPTIKLLFSRALRAPTAYELHYNSPANFGNHSLQPERTQSLEAVAEHAIAPSMTVHGSVYRNTYRDLIVDTSDAAGFVGLENGLDARATGVELGWSYARGKGVRARASYSRQFEGDAVSEAWTSGAPRHLAKINFSLPVQHLGVRAAFEVQYESERRTYAGEALAPATLANLNVIREQVLPGLDLKASVLNLFDQRYAEPVSENHRQAGIEQDGRQLFVGFTWRLQ